LQASELLADQDNIREWDLRSGGPGGRGSTPNQPHALLHTGPKAQSKASTGRHIPGPDIHPEASPAPRRPATAQVRPQWGPRGRPGGHVDGTAELIQPPQGRLAPTTNPRTGNAADQGDVSTGLQWLRRADSMRAVWSTFRASTCTLHHHHHQGVTNGSHPTAWYRIRCRAAPASAQEPQPDAGGITWASQHTNTHTSPKAVAFHQIWRAQPRSRETIAPGGGPCGARSSCSHCPQQG
jgi:hypothetical protein